MGELGGFINKERHDFHKRDPKQRVHDYQEFLEPVNEQELKDQGARCMDCGIPFCQAGCPVGNLIPDWNDLVYKDQWYEAYRQLDRTNDFPEFTGLICPAPCESACVLDINDDAVTIKQIELAIINHAFEHGWVKPQPPASRTGKKIAVIGSGPAGLAIANQLNRRGHSVTVFEKDELPGGLMRFGVPDPKLEKWIIERRTNVMEEEGIIFRCSAKVGENIALGSIHDEFDAIAIAIGSRVHRDVELPGHGLAGIHYAMDYLYQRNRWVAQQQKRLFKPEENAVVTEGKNVVVIGGGDTGMDCIANALREGAKQAIMLDYYPPLSSDGRYLDAPWPFAPKRTPTTYALEEGGKRNFSSRVTKFLGENGKLKAVAGSKVTDKRPFEPVPNTDFVVEADVALIAIGFAHPRHEGLVEELNLNLDSQGNIKAGLFETSRPGVFVAGDARVGQSLIVTAIDEGRKCARMIDRYLAQKK